MTVDMASNVPIRPSSVPGESLPGYLARVMVVNGYHHPLPWRAWFPKGSDFDVTLSNLGLDCQKISELQGPLPGGRCRQQMSDSVPTSEVNQHRLRWCPLCIASDGIHRGIWTLKLVGACPEHSVILLDECPVCSKPVTPSDAGMTRCTCGTLLHAGPVERANTAEIALMRWIAAASAGQRAANPCHFADMNTGQWLELVRNLSIFGRSLRPQRYWRTPETHLIGAARQVITASAEVLYDWPNRYHLLLLKILRAAPEGKSMVQTFGPMHRLVYNNLQARAFQFLRKAFEDFLAENWWRMPCRQNRRLADGLKSAAHRISGGSPRSERAPTQIDWIDGC